MLQMLYRISKTEEPSYNNYNSLMLFNLPFCTIPDTEMKRDLSSPFIMRVPEMDTWPDAGM